MIDDTIDMQQEGEVNEEEEEEEVEEVSFCYKTETKVDLSTFWKRVSYYASLSNPRGFLTKDKKIE